MKVRVLVIVGILVFAFYYWACIGRSIVTTNSQMKAIYEKSSDKGMEFTSRDYSFTDYEGDKSITWPTDSFCYKVDKPIGWPINSRWIKISNISGTFSLTGNSKGVNIPSLWETVRVCYKGRPFYQEDGDFETTTETDSTLISWFGTKSPIEFLIAEKTIGSNSFAIITKSHDFQGQTVGLYVNGNIICRNIMVKGNVPYVPTEVKKVGKEIIICFVNANRSELYVLYEIEKNQLILPIDYESIENSYKTASKETN